MWSSADPASKIVTIGALLILGLLVVGWILLQKFVSELSRTRDAVARGQATWDAAAQTAQAIDKTLGRHDDRISRLEKFDLMGLIRDFGAMSGRLATVEHLVGDVSERIDGLVTAEADTNAIVKGIGAQMETIVREVRDRKS